MSTALFRDACPAVHIENASEFDEAITEIRQQCQAAFARGLAANVTVFAETPNRRTSAQEKARADSIEARSRTPL